MLSFQVSKGLDVKVLFDITEQHNWESCHPPALWEKSRVCSLSQCLCLSQWETVRLWSFSLLRPRAHLWTIKGKEHGRVPAIWMWPSANCLHQHTLPLQSCLEPCLPLPLTWLHRLSPCLSTRPLRAHTRHSVLTETLSFTTTALSHHLPWSLRFQTAAPPKSNCLALHLWHHSLLPWKVPPIQQDDFPARRRGCTERGRQHLFKHKYLWYLAKRQETRWETTEEAKIPIYMMLHFQGSSLVKARCSAFFRSSLYARISRWLFLQLSGSLGITLEFKSIWSLKRRMSLQVLHLLFHVAIRWLSWWKDEQQSF